MDQSCCCSHALYGVVGADGLLFLVILYLFNGLKVVIGSVVSVIVVVVVVGSAVSVVGSSVVVVGCSRYIHRYGVVELEAFDVVVVGVVVVELDADVPRL